MRWLGGLVGAVFLAIGAFTTNVGLQVNAAFGADPACTASLTLETPARSGKTCVIHHGSVSQTYTTHGSKGSTQHHIVVMSESGVMLDVEPEFEFWSPVFARATPGSLAVVETVKGMPAFVATSAGSLSAIGNPRTMVMATAGITGLGALMIYLAVRPRKRAAPARPPYRTSR